MASKSMILSYFVTKQLLTEHIYDLPINGKYIKFGARFRFDTLNKNNHHSYYIFCSGGTICNPRWPTKKTGIQYNFELSAKNEFSHVPSMGVTQCRPFLEVKSSFIFFIESLQL